LNYGYRGSHEVNQQVRFGKNSLANIKSDAFVKDGRLYSYACRTGTSVEDLGMGFDNEEDAKPENSLAQAIANHFDIEVYAFLRRTYYGNIIRNRSDSEAISKALKKARKNRDGEVIDIPPEHEALPHEGLADSWHGLSGPEREGADGYALWGKKGGLGLPSAADSPKGLPKEMQIFKKPKPKPKEEPVAKK
jgi:hypothetical protein